MKQEEDMQDGKTWRTTFICFGCEVQVSANDVSKIMPIINEHKDC